jgi:hypothetical protein
MGWNNVAKFMQLQIEDKSYKFEEFLILIRREHDEPTVSMNIDFNV